MGMPEQNNFSDFLTPCLPAFEFNTNAQSGNMISLDPFVVNSSFDDSFTIDQTPTTTTLPMDPAISALVNNPSLLFSFSNTYHQNLPASVNPTPLQPVTNSLMTSAQQTSAHLSQPISVPKALPTVNQVPDNSAPKSKRGRKSTKTANPSAQNVPTQPSTQVSSPTPIANIPATPVLQPRALSTIPIKPANAQIIPIAPRVEPMPEPIMTESEKLRQQVLNKKQERLIKNRAAALLSRKRKREHLVELESQNEALSSENQELKDRIRLLEAQLAAASQNTSSVSIKSEQENSLKSDDQSSQSSSNSKAKPIGASFLILLFSFCFFTLSPAMLSNSTGLVPSAYSPLASSQSYSYTNSQSSTPLIDPSPQLLFLDSSKSLSLFNTNSQDQYNNENMSQELSIIRKSSSSSQALTTISAFHRRVDTQEFTSWILNHPNSHITCPKTPNSDLAPLSSSDQPSEDVAYLFSDRLTRFIPKNIKNQTDNKDGEGDECRNQKFPQLSIISPWAISQDGKEAQYLRLDVEVKSTKLVGTNDMIR
jgi:cell division protein FtsB